VKAEDEIEALYKLQKLHDLGLLSDKEYTTKKDKIVDGYIGIKSSQNLKKTTEELHRRTVIRGNLRESNETWVMPRIFTPQVKWLISLLRSSMPRSYDDVLPASRKSFWITEKYLSEGPINPIDGKVIAFDHDVSIQERSLTHVGLNIYDGAVWAVALSLSGFGDIVDVYFRNVLYVSTTGSNPFADGLKSIRASSRNADQDYYYGVDQISDKDLDPVTMPGNMTFVHFEDPQCCGVCCPTTFINEIAGGYMYRMIGPTYLMNDPFQGFYGWRWRVEPAGPNNDTTTPWNLAGIIHWNDWKPITGENVWASILAPMQTIFIRNCTKVREFSKFEDAPDEVQLAISIMPACNAMMSPLGSMYHCPLGTEMFPPDPDEKTNVSNENNFSAYAAFMAMEFIFENFYKGSDPVLDAAHRDCQKLRKDLEGWFAKFLMPNNEELGANVISQGGHVSFEGVYYPQGGKQAFAVDCQTWGLLNLGVKFFDQHYGDGKAYQVWQDTKKLGGFFRNGVLHGVGYTNHNTMNNGTGPFIWSGEWSWGAVFMLKRIGYEYVKLGKTAWGNEMLNEAKVMVEEMQKPAKVDDDGIWIGGGLVQVDGSYLYANDRFFIPWGWYSNPIGATSSTGWAVYDTFSYNPFILGGGAESTFFDQQCEGNEPNPNIFAKLQQFYGYVE
jgi:hypothetical protein